MEENEYLSKNKTNKLKIWQISTGVLAILLIAAVITSGFRFGTDESITGNVVADSTPEQTPSQEITKTDKPNVELFVMSFCPYGVQAETAMKPVVDLLGDSADI